MKVIDEKVLDEFRAKLRCELCDTFGPTQPHHVHCKGMGGARRVDLRINLISLCVQCHAAFHNGRIEVMTLLVIVAKREKTTVKDIREEIWRLRRL